MAGAAGLCPGLTDAAWWTGISEGNTVHNVCIVYFNSMTWEVEYTDQFGNWFETLDEESQERVAASVQALQDYGPDLGRPLVDTIQTSRNSNMKELRPLGGNIRVLFAFDPRRMAILLIGGDKSNRWHIWYREYVPLADDLYDEHLDTLRREGLLPW